ncbi:hypothetical protein GCM10027018_02560 [Paenibacillus thermoaerophilus]
MPVKEIGDLRFLLAAVASYRTNIPVKFDNRMAPCRCRKAIHILSGDAV